MLISFKRLRDLAECLGRLRPHLRGGRWLLAAVLGSSLLMTLFEGVGVGLLVPLLSLLMEGEKSKPMRPIQWLEGAFPGQSSTFYVVAFAVFIVGAIWLKNLAVLGGARLSARFKRRVEGNLREALFNRLHAAELQIFEQRTSGELSNIFFEETSRANNAFDCVIALVQRGSMGVIYLAALFYISWSLTLFVTLLAIVIGGSLSVLFGRLYRLGVELTQSNQVLAKLVSESFAGVRLIRATNSAGLETERFRRASQAQLEIQERTNLANAHILPVAESVAILGAMLLICGAYFLYVKGGLLLSSHLFGFCFILLRLIPLLNQLYVTQGYLLHAANGVEQVEKWLSLVQYPQKEFGNLDLGLISSAVRFESVSFAYSNGKEALKDVSFELLLGGKVALVGASGSGKSTIASLVLRLRPPTSGRITVNGRDHWDYCPNSWHKAVAIVDQDTFLFHDTLLANIKYGATDVTEAEVQKAAETANLMEFVDGLPDGMETLVGNRGVQLSGGQRQRVAIARAILRNPQLLILDEATSSLDTVSELHVQKALEAAVHSRTVLVIAHRLSTVRNADRIVVLEGGQVVEHGPWDELVARNGAFARLLSSGSLLHG